MSRVFAELVKVGVSEDAASDIAESVRVHETMATKQDLLLLKADLTTEIGTVRTEIAELKADLFKHTTQVLVWMTAINAALLTSILALFRYLER